MLTEQLNVRIEREIHMRKDKENRLLATVDQKTKFLRGEIEK
jgi:hypothetical protein